jgi:hypothetical protein
MRIEKPGGSERTDIAEGADAGLALLQGAADRLVGGGLQPDRLAALRAIPDATQVEPDLVVAALGAYLGGIAAGRFPRSDEALWELGMVYGACIVKRLTWRWRLVFVEDADTAAQVGIVSPAEDTVVLPASIVARSVERNTLVLEYKLLAGGSVPAAAKGPTVLA